MPSQEMKYLTTAILVIIVALSASLGIYSYKLHKELVSTRSQTASYQGRINDLNSQVNDLNEKYTSCDFTNYLLTHPQQKPIYY